MDVENFNKLLLNFENSDIEFRSDFSKNDRDVKTIGAFYNTRGGIIVYGIAEDGARRKTVGLPSPPQIFEMNLNSKIRAACSECNPAFEFVELGGHTCLIVRCPRGEKPPYRVYGEIYIRRGSNSVKATDEEISAMYRDSSPETYDATPMPRAELSDMDEQQIKNYLEDTGGARILEGDFLKMIQRMRLVRETGNKICPTLAGLLLFGKNPQELLPFAKIKAEVRLNDDAVDWDDVAEIGGNLFEQLKGVESFIKRNIKTEAKIIGFERQERMEIPIEALREAVVNAIVHRDYSKTGSEIFLRIKSHSVIVENPGGLVPPLTIDEVLTASFIPKTRNPIIADVLNRSGYMDKRGTGFIRMKKLMEQDELAAPAFTELPDGFRVEFLSSHPSNKKKIFIPKSEYAKINPDKDQKIILRLIEKRGQASTRECEDAIRKSRPVTIRKIKDLISKGLIEPNAKSPYSPKMAYKIHHRFSEGLEGQKKSSAESNQQLGLFDGGVKG